MKKGKTLKSTNNLYFTVLVGVAGTVYASYYALADSVATSFGQTGMAVGYFVALYTAGMLCSTFLGGAFADRLGKRLVVLAALFVMALGCLLLALPFARAFILAGIFLIGMGAGGTETLSSAVLTEENPTRATRWMNISQIFFCIGAIAAPIAAVWFSARNKMGYAGVFAVLALCTLLCALAYFTRRRPSGRQSAPKEKAGSANLFSVLGNKQFLLICVLVFIYLSYESLIIAFIKQFFLQRGTSETVAAAAISVFWLSMIVCRLVGIFLDGKEWNSIALLCLVFAGGIATLLLAQGTVLLFAGTALLGIGCGPLWPMLFSLGGRQHPGRSGAAFAVMSLFSTGAGTLSPILLGTVTNNLNLSFTICAGLALLLAALCLLNKKRYKV